MTPVTTLVFRLTLVSTLGFLFSVAVHAEPHIVGKVVGIQDGDTITLLDPDLQQHRVRLAGIDAPEKGQPFGQVSKVHLSTLCHGKLVRAHCPKEDHYGRRVCTVFVDSLDVNLAQVTTGFAWHYKRFAHEQSAREAEAYAQAEETARTQKFGLWQDHNPVPPWEWRSLRRRVPSSNGEGTKPF